MVVTCYSSTRLLSSRVLFVCWQCLSWWRYASYSLSADNVNPDGGMLRTVCLLTVSILMAVCFVQSVSWQCLPWWRYASYSLSADSVYPDGGTLGTVCLLTMSTLMAVCFLQVSRSFVECAAPSGSFWGLNVLSPLISTGLKDRCQVQRLRHQHETWVGLLALWTRKVLCGSFLCAIYKFSFIHSFSHFT